MKLVMVILAGLLHVAWNVTAQSGDTGSFYDDGKASYYAQKFHGKKTASGETFNNFDYTAAHRTLPFNTYLNVINESNKFNVIVRVNDRGPFTKSRILDLSEAAARSIGGYQKGVVRVRIQELNLLKMTPELEQKFNSGNIVDCFGNPATPPGWLLSIWSTTELIHAIYVANDLYLKEKSVQIYMGHKYQKGVKRYHVLVSGLDEDAVAEKIKDTFERKGFMKVTLYKP